MGGFATEVVAGGGAPMAETVERRRNFERKRGYNGVYIGEV